MAKIRERISLNDGIEFTLRDGSVVHITPGPHGKGITVAQTPSRPGRPSAMGKSDAASDSAEPNKRGRKPRASTVALRAKLHAEAASGTLAAAPQYVNWLLEQDAQIGLAMARTIVYREMKKFS